MAIERVAVIGAGEWGTALAQAAASAGRHVTLIGRDPDVLAEINVAHTNRKHLGMVRLSPHISASSRYSGADLVILAVPAQATREALTALGNLGEPVVLSAKGLEHGTLLRQSQILNELAPNAVPFVLSGPSFAEEIGRGLPAALVVASHDAAVGAAVQGCFGGDRLRIYTSNDVTGVCLGGALKNVIAIAVGCCDGFGFGDNARAALITRGLVEMGRLAERMGGQALTLAGLAGLGDLVLTCTGGLSRNRRTGLELAKGRTLAEIEGETTEVAEGVRNSLAVRRLAAEKGVEMPIVEQMCAVLHEGKPPRQALGDLMTRELKDEARL